MIAVSIHKRLIVPVALLVCALGFSQLSNRHYIPPITTNNIDQAIPTDHYIYISTPSTDDVDFTITPIGDTAITGTVSNANPYVHNIGTGFTQFIVDPNGTSNILANKGYIIEADNAIYVSVRVNSANQAGALVSKGASALGNTFRVGGFTNTNNSFLSFVSVIASEDNTQISFNDLPSDIVLQNYSGSLPVNITLNAGESYILSAQGSNVEKLIGCWVQSDKPIAVNCGSACGGFGTDNSKKDYGIDQIVDLNRVGTEYIFVKGEGGNTWENILIVAHTNNTAITANGTTLATINAGDYYVIEGNYYSSNDNMYVTTSSPVFAYQGIGTDASREQNQGLFFVPPLNCETRGNLNNIAQINRIGNTTYTGGLSIITGTGTAATLTINGQALSNYNVTGPRTVTGNTNYVTYKVTGLTGNVSVESDGELYCAYFNANNNATAGSFYSGFPSAPEISFDTDECFNAVILTASNFSAFDSIEWLFNNGSGWTSTGITTETYTATQLGTYRLRGTIACTGSSIESDEIEITQFNTLNTPPALVQCEDDDATTTSTYFNLTEIEDSLYTGTSTVTFTYYESETDAETENNPISNPTAYAAETSTSVWARATIINPDCYDVAEIVLEISSTNANNATLNACDNDDGVTDNLFSPSI
ncbi:MAG: IgGFc-binding protein [Flavobacteriaceae bacterium]